MATGPNSLGGGPKQPGRTGGDEGAYFEGEGEQPFEERAGDADSREAEAVVDDLISEFTGGGSPAPATGAAPPPATGGMGSGSPAGGGTEGTAATSGTSRGSASTAPAAGRMG